MVHNLGWVKWEVGELAANKSLNRTPVSRGGVREQAPVAEPFSSTLGAQ